MSWRAGWLCCACALVIGSSSTSGQAQGFGEVIDIIGGLIEQNRRDQQEQRSFDAENHRAFERQEAKRSEARRQEVILVRRLQAALGKLGFYNGKVDGDRGPATRKAEALFRRAFETSPISLDEDSIAEVEAFAESGYRSMDEIMTAANSGKFSANGDAALLDASSATVPETITTDGDNEILAASEAGSDRASGNPAENEIGIISQAEGGTTNASSERQASAGYQRAAGEYASIVARARSLAQNARQTNEILQKQHGLVLGEAKQPFDILGIRIGDDIASVNNKIGEIFPKSSISNYFFGRDINSKDTDLSIIGKSKNLPDSSEFNRPESYIITRQYFDLGDHGSIRAYFDHSDKLVHFRYHQNYKGFEYRKQYVDLFKSINDKYGYPTFVYHQGHERRGVPANGYPFAKKDACSDIFSEIKTLEEDDFPGIMYQHELIKAQERNRKLVEAAKVRAHNCLIDDSFDRRPTDIHKLNEMLLDEDLKDPDSFRYAWFCDHTEAYQALGVGLEFPDPEKAFAKGIDDVRYCTLQAEIDVSDLTLTLSDFSTLALDSATAGRAQNVSGPDIKF